MRLHKHLLHFRTRQTRLPVEKIIGDRPSAAISGRIPLQILKLFVQSFECHFLFYVTVVWFHEFLDDSADYNEAQIKLNDSERFRKHSAKPQSTETSCCAER